ncbi:MAG: hypothetical protein AAFS13_10790, partial [Pseudomonadota bacterium]
RIWVCFVLAVLSPYASAQTSIRAEYHAPTNLFAVMDETAYWYPGFNNSEHREAWTERFGWSREDQAIANRYKRYRKRTFDDSDQTDAATRLKQDGIFITRSSIAPEADPLGAHFFRSATIEDALTNLESIMSASDAEMLRSFYAHFRPKWQSLLDESEAFASQAAELDIELTSADISTFLRRVSAFYSVDDDLEFTMRLVWWPPVRRTFAYAKGQTFLLYRHPVMHIGESDRADIAIHEAVHYISAHQTFEQKRTLSERFLEGCPVAVSANQYDLLEEPLAIAWGQIAFAKYVRGEQLDLSDSLYSRALPDLMAKLIWLEIDAIYESDETISDGLIDTAAKHCAAVLETSKALRQKSRWFGWLQR